MEWQEQAVGLGSALAAGALIGIERGWTLRAQNAGTRVAGIRTFALLGLVGGLAGVISGRGMALVGFAMVAAASAILTMGYSGSLRERHDSTTAVTALVTLGAGFLSGLGEGGLALAAAAATVLILALRNELHGFLARLDARDVKDLARFAVIALAVLPFLPDREIGPYKAWNPTQLWWIIILVTGFSFAGYIANRLFGARHGTIATAAIGGAYSSTAVTQSLAQRLGAGVLPGTANAGIALASGVMYVRAIALVAVLANRILWPFVLIVAPALLVAIAAGWWLYRKTQSEDAATAPGNPIALLPALGFVVFVAFAAVAARWAEGRFGAQGIAILLFTMGALDVDASIVTAGGLPPTVISDNLAAIAIGGTIVANMSVKIGTTLFYARRAGLPAVIALTCSTIVLGIALTAASYRL
jgi:uncharacterized membrane protein (DUF4010 family)